MVFVRSIVLVTALVVGATLAAPSIAQTSATLRVTARVVEECTVKSKRELIKLARKRNDPGLIRRCSKGVVSRVSHGVIKRANLRPPVAVPAKLSKKYVSRSTIDGMADVVLVTVTY